MAYNLLIKIQRTKKCDFNNNCVMNFYNNNSKNEIMFEKFLNWGIAHTNSKNYDEALKFFRKVISLKPKSFFALRCIGDVFKYKKDYKNALYFYHQSLRINPNYIDAINECATILKKMVI